MAGTAYKSKLVPYFDFIKQARKEHVSYREIARILNEKYSLDVTHSSIFSFVKVRSKRRKVITMLDDYHTSQTDGFKTDQNRKKTAEKETSKTVKFEFNSDLPID